MTFKEYTKKNGLILKKVVENIDQSLTLYIEADKGEADIIERDLTPFFDFASGLHVKLEEFENKEQTVSFETPEFSLEDYQKKILKLKEEEIQSQQVQKKEKDESYTMKPGEYMCGSAFEVEPMPIEEIDFSETVHENNICIEGDIFNQEIKEVSGKSDLVTLAVTDYTGSIYLKRFVKKNKKRQRALLEKYTVPGTRIRIFGSLEYDDFLSATCFKPKILFINRQILAK